MIQAEAPPETPPLAADPMTVQLDLIDITPPRHDSSGDNNRYGNDSNDSNRNTYKSAALDDRGGGFLTTSFQEARDAPPVLVADYNKFDPRMTIGIRGHETEPPKPPGIA
jgi:hypothetical protein